MDWSLEGTSALRAAQSVALKLQEAGHAAYFAGGCVRDLLLCQPAKDFDVATSARPDEVVSIFSQSGLRTVQVGAHFGVILVCLPDGDQSKAIEVATFRHDGVYLDGRRPESVQFSNEPREDVLRRDFTINGMLLDPAKIQPDDDGQLRAPQEALLDFVGGRADLDRRLVRAIGDPIVRFGEDKLRMLRGVRFAARLGFEIEPATLRATQQHAADIDQVSNERVRDELTRMLTEGHACAAFEWLDRSGLLPEVLPEVARMKGVQQSPDYHPEGDVWVHTLLLLEKLPADASATLAWGFLLHDVGKPATYQPPNPDKPGDRIRFNGHVEVGIRIAEVILERLRFSNEEKSQILSLIQHHMQFGDVKAMKASTLKRFIRMPQFEEHLILHRADCLSSHGDLRLWDYAKDAWEHDEPEHARPKWLVSGRELIAAGYKPGARFKKMLATVEDAQLEGRILTVDEGMELVRKEFGLA